jgi:hypothetical protein
MRFDIVADPLQSFARQLTISPEIKLQRRVFSM